MRRLVAAGAAAAALLALAGCGNATPATISTVNPTPTATATDQTTMLPQGWPTQIQLPAGASINSSSDDAGQMTVTFESTELGKSVTAFLNKEITGAGFQSGPSTVTGQTWHGVYTQDAKKLDVTVMESAGDTVAILALHQG